VKGDVVFSHIGLSASSIARSRAFYENAPGCRYRWELTNLSDDATAPLLQLDRPVGLNATYLVRDGLVLELLEYAPERLEVSVKDLDQRICAVRPEGGAVIDATRADGAVMVRDPDGQLVELLTFRWRESLPPMPD